MKLSNRRILVTGGGGFLGQYVCAELERRGVAKRSLFVPRRREYDLTKASAAARLFKKARPSVVIHLAAEVGGIGANRKQPGRFFYANMAMGLNVIEQARIHRVKKIVQVGTVCSYPKHTPVPFKEDDLWNGYPEETNAPYGIAKKALLVMLQAYRAQYGLNGIYLIPVNLYGPGDDFDPASSHVIPALIRKFIAARDRNRPTVTVWGSGRAGREFLYVEDCARGIVQATLKYDGAAPINLGRGEEITIRRLAETIKTLTGYRGRIAWDRSMPDGQPRRRLDTRRAEKLLGFTARVSLNEGLKRTIHWYEEQRKAPARELV